MFYIFGMAQNKQTTIKQGSNNMKTKLNNLLNDYALLFIIITGFSLFSLIVTILEPTI